MQTADGDVNGSIRLGSRASMTYGIAMNEIGYTEGGGCYTWRTMFNGVVWTGPIATATFSSVTAGWRRRCAWTWA